MRPGPIIAVFVFLLNLLFSGCTTIHKIRLKRVPIANINRRAKDLVFLNFADTAYLNIIRSGDMGIRYNSYYEFKPHANNAKYLIFVDDTLVEKRVFKNGQQHGKNTTYVKGIKYCTVPYYNGKVRGKRRCYFPDGKINGVTVYQNGSAIIRWTYNENHKLTREEFFIGHAIVREVDYDAEGRLKKISGDRQWPLQSEPDTIGLMQSGRRVYKYKPGFFTVDYKNGKNKKWKFTPTIK